MSDPRVTDAKPTGNSYLDEPFTPVHSETTAFDLPETGSIPPELCGRLLRTGPNPIIVGDASRYHWFREQACCMASASVRGAPSGIAIVGCVDKVAATLNVEPLDGPRPAPSGIPWVEANAVNTNVLGHAGRTWVVAEQGVYPNALSYELESLCRSDFDGTLRGGYPGHPHRDPLSGELHAVSYFPRWNFPQVSNIGYRRPHLSCGGYSGR